MIGESNIRAAFKIENAKSVTITLAAGSNNILKSGLEYAGLQNDSVPLIIGIGFTYSRKRSKRRRYWRQQHLWHTRRHGSVPSFWVATSSNIKLLFVPLLNSSEFQNLLYKSKVRKDDNGLPQIQRAKE